MNFFLNVIKITKEKFHFVWRQLKTEYPAQNVITADDDGDSRRIWMQWSLIGVCVAAIAITVQALQTLPGMLHSMSFHWICTALVFSSAAVLVSIHIPAGDYRIASLLAVHVGIFIAFTALVAALAINLHPLFKAASIAVYSIGIFIIIVANLRKSA